jgi:hypothetical protein
LAVEESDSLIVYGGEVLFALKQVRGSGAIADVGAGVEANEIGVGKGKRSSAPGYEIGGEPEGAGLFGRELRGRNFDHSFALEIAERDGTELKIVDAFDCDEGVPCRVARLTFPIGIGITPRAVMRRQAGGRRREREL